MKGRVPRPREERIREGATRNLPEPLLVAGRADLAEVMDPPTPLSAEALAWWRDVVPALADAGLVERVDVYVLACAASAWGEVVQADRVLKEEGLFDLGSVGQIVPHAATKLKRDAMGTFEKYLNHLALSPVARARLGLAHLHGRALMQEMDRVLGRDSPGVIDTDLVEEDEDDVLVPGV